MEYKCAGCGELLITEEGDCVKETRFSKSLNIEGKVQSWCLRCAVLREKELHYVDSISQLHG